MRMRTCGYLFAAALGAAALGACSSAGPSGALTSLSPDVKHLAASSPPAVVALNHSSIVETVTQSTPRCWSPAGATIEPGKNVTFEPISVSPCYTGHLVANATGASCVLGWNGETITISNSPATLCLWSLNSTLHEGAWAYELLSTSGS